VIPTGYLAFFVRLVDEMVRSEGTKTSHHCGQEGWFTTSLGTDRLYLLPMRVAGFCQTGTASATVRIEGSNAVVFVPWRSQVYYC